MKQVQNLVPYKLVANCEGKGSRIIILPAPGMKVPPRPVGITPAEAHYKYGDKILRASEALKYFLDKPNEELKVAAPVLTRPIVGFTYHSLGDSIEKEGNRSFIPAFRCGYSAKREGVWRKGEYVWRLQIDDRILTPKNLKTGEFFLSVSKGVVTHKEGENEYTSILSPDNDMRAAPSIKYDGRSWEFTTEHPAIFGGNAEKHDIFLGVYTEVSGIVVSLVSVGNYEFSCSGYTQATAKRHASYREVHPLAGSKDRDGLLIYADSDKKKA